MEDPGGSPDASAPRRNPRREARHQPPTAPNARPPPKRARKADQDEEPAAAPARGYPLRVPSVRREAPSLPPAPLPTAAPTPDLIVVYDALRPFDVNGREPTAPAPSPASVAAATLPVAHPARNAHDTITILGPEGRPVTIRIPDPNRPTSRPPPTKTTPTPCPADGAYLYCLDLDTVELLQAANPPMECQICMEDVGPETACSRCIFCKKVVGCTECVMQWVNTKQPAPSCPNCRSSWKGEQLEGPEAPPESSDHFGREHTPPPNGENVQTPEGGEVCSILPSKDTSPASSPSNNEGCEQIHEWIFDNNDLIYTLSSSRPFAYGAYGKVFHATRHDDDSEVVIKMGEVSWLNRECRILSKVEAARSPANIGLQVLKYHEIFHITTFDHKKWGIVSERLGPSQREMRDASQRIRYGCTWRNIVSIGKQIADGLVFLHEAGIIHMDLKSENVLFCTDPAVTRDFTVKIIDLGIAKTIDEMRSSYGMGGNWSTKAPEQLIGLDEGLISDVWSLGCVMVELVIGQCLFPTAREEVLYCVHSIFRIPQSSLAMVSGEYSELIEERRTENGRLLDVKTPSADLGYYIFTLEIIFSHQRMYFVNVEFKDAILKAFVVDPKDRPSSWELSRIFGEFLEQLE